MPVEITEVFKERFFLQVRDRDSKCILPHAYIAIDKEELVELYIQAGFLLHPEGPEEPKLCPRCAEEAQYGPKSMQEA